MSLDIHCPVEVNFGAKPFVFDLPSFEAHVRRLARLSDVPALHHPVSSVGAEASCLICMACTNGGRCGGSLKGDFILLAQSCRIAAVCTADGTLVGSTSPRPCSDMFGALGATSKWEFFLREGTRTLAVEVGWSIYTSWPVSATGHFCKDSILEGMALPGERVILIFYKYTENRSQNIQIVDMLDPQFSIFPET